MGSLESPILRGQQTVNLESPIIRERLLNIKSIPPSYGGSLNREHVMDCFLKPKFSTYREASPGEGTRPTHPKFLLTQKLVGQSPTTHLQHFENACINAGNCFSLLAQPCQITLRVHFRPWLWSKSSHLFEFHWHLDATHAPNKTVDFITHSVTEIANARIHIIFGLIFRIRGLSFLLNLFLVPIWICVLCLSLSHVVKHIVCTFSSQHVWSLLHGEPVRKHKAALHHQAIPYAILTFIQEFNSFSIVIDSIFQARQTHVQSIQPVFMCSSKLIMVSKLYLHRLKRPLDRFGLLEKLPQSNANYDQAQRNSHKQRKHPGFDCHQGRSYGTGTLLRCCTHWLKAQTSSHEGRKTIPHSCIKNVHLCFAKHFVPMSATFHAVPTCFKMITWSLICCCIQRIFPDKWRTRPQPCRAASCFALELSV